MLQVGVNLSRHLDGSFGPPAPYLSGQLDSCYAYYPGSCQDTSGSNTKGPKVNIPCNCGVFIRPALRQQVGSVDIIAELNGNDVHRLENVMTMEVGLFALIDSLVYGLKPRYGTVWLLWHGYI